REELSDESRVSARAVVDRKSFRARLRRGPSGVYRVAVRADDTEVLAERLVLGPPGDIPASWGTAPAKLEAARERLQGLLRTAVSVSREEAGATADLQKAFLKSLVAEETALAELGLKSDFTATVGLLGRVCELLRNAQIWGARPADDGPGALLEDGESFESLEQMLASAPAVLAAERKASVAGLLCLLAARAAENAKHLNALQGAARKAAAALEGAAPGFVAAVEATAHVGEAELPELRRRLEALRDELVDRLPEEARR
ncbi:MAG TPA: hypothetical protein VEJ18_20150, partial [Planctomycetota bacterium]|nr:hypothetical protein [Planctomycetota bacterium]